MDKNRLGEETSPYLLQHKDNPVHWRAWGPEALAEAKAEDKPILLSVGYAACHWCHVMAHESFENPAIAAAMNQDFINIKIDREELKQAMQSLAETWDMGGEKAANPMLKAWGMAVGLPAWRKTVKEDEGEVTETTLVSINRGSVPRSVFEPPAGFTKKEIGREKE